MMNATCGKVIATADIVAYMEKEFVMGEPGAFKGVLHPDGRKDNVPPPAWVSKSMMGMVPDWIAAACAGALLANLIPMIGFALARKK